MGWRFISLFIFPVLAAAQGQKYKPGDALPDLHLPVVYSIPGTDRDSIRLSDFRGKKILLTFNRYVSCPLCNFRTHELISINDSLKQRGLVVISVYESTRMTLQKYTSKEDMPFIMIPDQDETVYKLFKVQKSWLKSFSGLFRDYRRKHSKGKKLFKSDYAREGDLNRIGADFLIDEQGIVRVAYYGKYVGDHLPVEQILKWSR